MTIYYLRIITSDGSQLPDASHNDWFTVDLPTSGIANTFSSNLQIAGKPTFSPLTLSFAPNATLENTLLGDLVAGTTITGIEIAGYTSSGNTGKLVDDYLYTGVQVTGLSMDGASDVLNLSYQSTQAEHYSTPGGAPATAAWDSLNDTPQLNPSVNPVSAGSAPPSTQVASLQGTASLTYYVQFTPLLGSALTDDSGPNTWIAINDPSFSMLNSGTTALDPLSLTLGRQSTASITLLHDLETGTKLKNVQIAAYESGKLVDDYTFATVGITSATSLGTAESFGFVYGQMQEAYTSYGAGGVAQPPVVNGWDALNNAADTTLPDNARATSPSSSSPVTSAAYYLRIITSDGSQLADASGNNWFTVNLPTSGIANTFSADLQSSGKPTFDPLTLNFASNATLEEALLGDLVAGTAIKGIEIAGYTSSGTTGRFVDDYLYTGVKVTGLSVGASSDTLTLSYQSTQAEHDSKPGGSSLSTAVWDSSDNTQLLNPSVTPVSAGSAPPSTTTPVGSLQGLADLTYYVQFTPLSGPALTDDSGANWIAITDPSFSLLNSGTTTLDPLSLTLGQLSEASITLLHDLETGSKLKNVEIAAYNDSGKLIDDYTFGTVGVTADYTFATLSGTATQIPVFAYGQMQEAYTSYSAGGVAQSPVVNGWDALNKAADTNLPDTAPATAPSSSSPATAADYYVRIITSDGSQLADASGNNWFTVDLPTSGIANTFSSDLQSSGKPTLDPLTLNFASNATLEEALLGDLVAGTAIKGIEIAGYTSSGTTGQFVDDYLYTGVKVTGLSVGASRDTLTLSYQSTQAEHYSTPGGASASTAAWDSLNNAPQLNPSINPVSAGSAPPSTTTPVGSLQGLADLTYYVQFTPLSGPALTDDSGANWIALTNAAFSLSNSGTTALDPLSLKLGQPSEATITLLHDLETGTKLQSVEIAAYESGKLVDDYTFATVGITNDRTFAVSGTADSFDFVYGQMQEAYTSYDPQGHPQAPVINGWDAINNVADTSLSHTAPATAPCYYPGTLIRTKRGQKKVEKLKIGDEVMTMSDKARPIKWIGRRSYHGRFALGQKHILPVCIKAGALDENLPRRDLWISPHHAMYLEGVLIEAKDLINGVTIVQAEKVEQVEYFHVELDTHDVIIAEGALSESFIDDDSRGMFHNAHEYRALYPDLPAETAHYCAPRLEDGYEVEAARRRIDGRAGLRTADDLAPSALRGYVDMVSSRLISGWAQNIDYPEAPVCLDIYAEDRLIGQTLANRYREDLQQAGLGSGSHSFEFVPPAGLSLSAAAVEVRRSSDGAIVSPSYTVYRRPRSLDGSRPELTSDARSGRPPRRSKGRSRSNHGNRATG